MIYFGPINQILEYFKRMNQECPLHYNPADYLLDIASRDSVGFIKNLAIIYKNSSIFDNVSILISHEIQKTKNKERFKNNYYFKKEYASSWLTQCLVLSKRTFINNIRNPYLIKTQYFLTIIIGTLLGMIYWHVENDIVGVQNRAGCIFFLIALLSFASMTSIDICIFFIILIK